MPASRSLVITPPGGLPAARQAGRLALHGAKLRRAGAAALYHLGLQPPSDRVAAFLTYGCSLHHLRLQVRLPEVKVLFSRFANWGMGAGKP